jgi:ACT domain-containing protein
VAETVTHDDIASTQEVYDVLEISRSAFYSWRSAPITKRESADMQLILKVITIFDSIEGDMALDASHLR